MRRTASLLVLVALLAGCGGGSHRSAPKLRHALGGQLAQRAAAIEAALEAGRDCDARRLTSELRAQVNRSLSQVPAALQEPLSSAVNALAADIRCTPAVVTPPQSAGSGTAPAPHGKEKGRHKEKRDGGDEGGGD
jgi:hypothetical protein